MAGLYESKLDKRHISEYKARSRKYCTKQVNGTYCPGCTTTTPTLPLLKVRPYLPSPVASPVPSLVPVPSFVPTAAPTITGISHPTSVRTSAPTSSQLTFAPTVAPITIPPKRTPPLPSYASPGPLRIPLSSPLCSVPYLPLHPLLRTAY